MPKKNLRFAALAGMALLAVGAISLVLVKSSGPGSNRTVRLADGSTLELRQVAFTNGFQYHHQSGNRLQRLFAPLAAVLPTYITQRFLSVSGGSMGFSDDGSTNLFVVTVNSSRTPGWWSDLRRLVVFDEQGNTYDACIGAGTTAMPGETAQAWSIHAFPRRNKWLGWRDSHIGIEVSA